jgi:ABC-type glycerol-3-phosphate transport system permease component
MLPPLFVAVAIHRCRSDRMQFLYRVLFVIPMVIPPLIVALIWRSFFFEATSGYLNQFIAAFHLRGVLNAIANIQIFGMHIVPWGDAFSKASQPAWLGDPQLIMTACIIWGFPWLSSLAVLTHLAKLQSIGKDVYEAADIDGVSWWSKFTRIELPLITGSIYIMLVFTIIGTIQDAGMILALAGMEGGPGGHVDVPALFMLRKAFVDQKMGYACAVGIILMLIVMSLQKLSSLVNDWPGFIPQKRRAIRLRLLGLAVGLNLLAPAIQVWGKTDLALYSVFLNPVLWLKTWFTQGLHFTYSIEFAKVLSNVSWLLLLAIIPYPTIFEFLFGRFRRKAVEDNRWSDAEPTVTTSYGDRRMEKVIAREDNRAYCMARSAGCGLLRFNKHLSIWFVLAFALLPLYLMIIVSFKTNAQFYEAPATITYPLHPENWVTAWHMITPTLANSVFLSVSSSILMLFIALASAYFFARLRVPLSSFFWNAILVLMMLPMIANLVPLFRLLRDMSLLNTLTALILVGAAQGQIFGIFMLRNFVSDIPQDLYEAAEIDGASHFRQMWMIVLPLSGPILGTVGVMHFMGVWNEFVMALIVMRDHARLPVMVQLIRIAGEYIKLWGPLMAGYAMAAVPIIILFIFSMKLFVRGMTEGAVKG